jgi:hypothetical protein
MKDVLFEASQKRLESFNKTGDTKIVEGIKVKVFDYMKDQMEGLPNERDAVHKAIETYFKFNFEGQDYQKTLEYAFQEYCLKNKL